MTASGEHRDGAESPNQLTIEQLAAQSGMSVRNIRSHQARGLLPPPEVRLRVGYYGPEHLAQLRLIRDLQAEGFNLAGIKRLLDDTQSTAERLTRFGSSTIRNFLRPRTSAICRRPSSSLSKSAARWPPARACWCSTSRRAACRTATCRRCSS